jgi:hypothetical protein
MTTSDDIKAIERLLERKQTVPSPLIRSLVMKCKQLAEITNAMQKEINRLKAERKQEEVQE